MKPSMSFSEYSMALQCLHKYKRVAIEGFKPPGLESGDMAFGTALHAGLSGYFEGHQGQEVFKSYWSLYEGKELTFGRFNWEQLGFLGVNFLRKFEAKYLPHLKPHTWEKRLYATYGGIALEGTPDFLGEYHGEMILADWKTSAQVYHKGKSLVSLQLHAYSYLVISNGLPAPKKLVYFPFVKGSGSIQTPVEVEFSYKRMEAHLDDMVAYINKFKATEHYPRNPNSCIMGSMECPLFEECWHAEP